jgi:hypothetical protein
METGFSVDFSGSSSMFIISCDYLLKIRNCEFFVPLYYSYFKINLLKRNNICISSHWKKIKLSLYLHMIANSTGEEPYSSRSTSQEIHRLVSNPNGSLPSSQEPATCPYPKPHESNPHPHTLFPWDHFFFFFFFGYTVLLSLTFASLNKPANFRLSLLPYSFHIS